MLDEIFQRSAVFMVYKKMFIFTFSVNVDVEIDQGIH